MLNLESHRDDSHRDQQQVAVLSVVFAGVVTAVFAEGEYTLVDSIIGVALVLALHGYDAKSDDRRTQSAAFAATWALCVMLIAGVFLNNFLLPVEPLWYGTDLACKADAERSDLAGFNEAEVAGLYVCVEGPFYQVGSSEVLLRGFEGGTILFVVGWLVLSVLMFVYRRYIIKRARAPQYPQ